MKASPRSMYLNSRVLISRLINVTLESFKPHATIASVAEENGVLQWKSAEINTSKNEITFTIAKVASGSFKNFLAK